MLYLTGGMGVAIAILSYILWRKVKEVAKLNNQLISYELTVEVLEKQNETLANAVKSNNPDYDVDKLFTGGF